MGFPAPTSSGPWRASLAVGTLLFAGASLVGACAEPLVYRDWKLPVPEGARVIEYAHVPVDQRTESLTLERDLVLTEAFGTPLYRPRDVKVAVDGTVFVLDSGNFRVVGFDAAGDERVSMGRQGQGPGELQGAYELALWNDGVIVNDTGNNRFSILAADGTLVEEHSNERRIYPRAMRQWGEKLLIIHPDPSLAVPIGREPRASFWRASIYGPDGSTEPELLVEFEKRRHPEQRQTDRATGAIPLRGPWPVEALGDGVLYYSDASEYQVRAIDAEGSPLWALRTDYVPTAVSNDDRRKVIELTRERHPELTASNFIFPSHYAAINGTALDGTGNLYVFPHAQRWPQEIDEADDSVPVDVYSPEGERLFAGTIAIDGWNAARGEHVYRIETDEASGEQVVARYRIAPSRW